MSKIRHKTIDISFPIYYNNYTILLEEIMDKFDVGTKVAHEQFGEGIVCLVEQSYIKVDFGEIVKTFDNISCEKLNIKELSQKQIEAKNKKIMGQFDVGTKVTHKEFGEGNVFRVEPNYIKVDFGDIIKIFDVNTCSDLEVKDLSRNQKRIQTLKKKSEYSEEQWENKYRFQDKYEQAKGIGVKSYKLNKQLAEDFKEVCKKIGRSQASVLPELMTNFIEKNS